MASDAQADDPDQGWTVKLEKVQQIVPMDLDEAEDGNLFGVEFELSDTRTSTPASRSGCPISATRGRSWSKPWTHCRTSWRPGRACSGVGGTERIEPSEEGQPDTALTP